MKFIWEEKDIICGRIVCKPTDDGKRFEADGWTAKWTMKIGFRPDLPHDEHYCLTAMTDGMNTAVGSAKDVADRFNKDGLIPMPHSWLLKTIEFLRDQYDDQRMA